MRRTEAFFSTSPFMRWTISPLLVLTLILLPVLVPEYTTGATIVMIGLELLGVLFLLGLWLPPRASLWAFRGAALLVFLAYVGYAATTLIESGGAIRFGDSRAESSPGNALLGLVVIGVPSLAFAVWPRRTDSED